MKRKANVMSFLLLPLIGLSVVACRSESPAASPSNVLNPSVGAPMDTLTPAPSSTVSLQLYDDAGVGGPIPTTPSIFDASAVPVIDASGAAILAPDSGL